MTWLLMLQSALADPVARVDRVWEQGERGLRPVSETDDAEWQRADQVHDVALGQELQADDTVRTSDGAAVRLDLGDGEQLLVRPGSALTLTDDRSVVQELGEVLYSVHGAFRVQHAQVEAAVEGTEFVVTVNPDGSVEVAVLEGVVVVSTPEGSVRVTRGRRARVELEGGAPVLLQWANGQGSQLRRTRGRSMGWPKAAGGVAVGGAFAAGSPQLQTRLIGRFGLPYGLGLSLDAGLEGWDGAFHLPLAAGLDLRLGQVALGVQSLNLLGQEVCPDGTTELRVHPGGVASIRAPIHLPGPVMLEVALRAGYARDPFVDVSVGVLFGR